MSYQPLARKYRPSRFDELVGQEAVAKALANSILSGRILSNLIFTGVRGIGKTTVARLYAKALNCEQRNLNAEPCNTCASCEAVTSGRHEDVLEIDGASNTGVADVRALQETIDYAPQRSEFKVYIIDEVHMLSAAAFNALLKTLEERRPHVIFIFATTELHKVPDTILSRCPTFHLRKLSVPAIMERLAAILDKEGIRAEERALVLLAREGHGSMRDALTLLDQAIALGDGQVTLAGLDGIVSNLSSSPYLDLLAALVGRDATAALAAIEALDQSGVDFADVVEATAQLARHAFVVRDLGSQTLSASLLGLDDAELSRLTALSRAAAVFDLNRIFRTLVKCRQDLDGSALDRFILENYCFEWCLDPGLPDLASLFDRPGHARVRSEDVGATREGQGEGALSQATRGLGRDGAPSGHISAGPERMRGVLAEIKERNQPGQLDPSQASQPMDLTQAAEAQLQSPTPVRLGASASANIRGDERGVFPPTWRALVDAWRKQKPLQARKLEEVHPLAYSPERIILAVSTESYASRSLLQKDEQARIREYFRELFGFQGSLQVYPKEEGSDVKNPERTSVQAETAEGAGGRGEAPLPETILAERAREGAARRKKLIDEARNAPFTQEVLAVLGGTIEDVLITGD